MKKLVVFLIIIIAVSCKSKQETKVKEEHPQTLTQFDNIKDMFVDASDYHEENGSLKFISNDTSNLHVQVSSTILEADIESVKNDIVKRDIVYVAFQTFAQTSTDKLTITAIPNDMTTSNKYYEKYKQTVTINREKAKQLLKKYLGSEDFSILYKKDGNYWLPNNKFSKLRFEKLAEVFSDIKG